MIAAQWLVASRSFNMHPRAIVLNKSHDIASTQARERHWSVAKSIGEEPVDKRHVIGDGCFRQRALTAQVVLENIYG